MSQGRSLGREAITVSSQELPLTVHRTDGTPPLFAGFQTEWASGQQDGFSYEMSAGPGLGSPYLTYSVTLPDGRTVHEYVNMIEFFQGRIGAILAENGID